MSEQNRPPGQDPGAGGWSYEPEQSWYDAIPRRPDFQAQSSQSPPPFPAPTGVPMAQPLSTYAAPQPAFPAAPAPTGRRRGGAGIVVLAAVVALLVGSVAGFGGARLAQRPAAAPAPSVTTQAPAPAPSSAQPSSNGAPSTPVPQAPSQLNGVQVAQTALPSTVVIEVGSQNNGSIGSGFVLDTAGRVMTNNHVVAAAAKGARIAVQFSDGRRTTATLVGRSPSYDLAVIQLRDKSNLKPMASGDSATIKVGQPVMAIGAPLGLPGTVTAGIVSATDRPVAVGGGAEADAPTAYINALQTDTAINPGNSGGPLLDASGRVIGVNSAILSLGSDQQEAGNIGLGFAIPINQAMQIGKLLISDGRASYPVIGATVDDTSGGAVLDTVEANGPAAKAGLRKGDVVTAVDDRAVSSTEELIVTVRTHRPKDQVRFRYERGSREGTATVTLGGKVG